MSLLAYCPAPSLRSIVRRMGHGGNGPRMDPGSSSRAKDVDPLQRG
jgi:hypothetical protein